MEINKKVLFVLTSHGELADTGGKTGFWIEEFVAPYYVLADAGADITIASPKGDQPPVDPKSEAPDNQSASTKRFYSDYVLIDKVAHTSEEEAVKLTKVVSFLLEDTLKSLGAHYSNGPDWGVYIKKDGLLITGQNPASSEEAARTLLEALQHE